MIVHGFPPRETAGTEQHVLQLRNQLVAQGHAVHVLSATRRPGARQYSVETSDGITRVVNNVTTRRLQDAEIDPVIDKITEEVLCEFKPDLVHVHHIQFLSAAMRFEVPMVLTLHDRWGWCAAGGLGLMPDGSRCSGPTPDRCAPCAGAWRPTPGALAQGMSRTAQLLRPVISPDRLHGLYRRIPAKLRPRPERGAGGTEGTEAAGRRNQIVGDFYRSADARISPSTHLAQEAEAQGLGPVHVIAHGIPDDFTAPSVQVREGLVHLGSIAHHKGTDIVVQGWQRAFEAGEVPLRLHGPIVDPEATLGHPVGRVLDRQGVAQALAGARALVLAPRWAENAPLIVLEARAMGCPVIAPETGGFPELIHHEVDGWLFDPEEPGALERAMQSAAAGPLPTPRKPPSFSAQADAIVAIYRSTLPPGVVECV